MIDAQVHRSGPGTSPVASSDEQSESIAAAAGEQVPLGDFLMPLTLRALCLIARQHHVVAERVALADGLDRSTRDVLSTEGLLLLARKHGLEGKLPPSSAASPVAVLPALMGSQSGIAKAKKRAARSFTSENLMNVLVIDDHPLILSAMQSLVQRLGDNVGVAAVATAQAARDALASRSDFDLVLLDLQLGDDSGFELLAELRTAYPALPVVVVAASDHRDDVMRAIDLGAMGFVPKLTSTETLLGALSMVLSGGIYLPPSIMRGAVTPRPSIDFARHNGWDERLDGEKAAATLATLGLTPRQKEVLALLLRGQSNKLIARALNLSVETIKDHVAAVLRSLKVNSRTQAVVAVSRMSSEGSVPAWRDSPWALSRHGG